MHVNEENLKWGSIPCRNKKFKLKSAEMEQTLVHWKYTKRIKKKKKYTIN